jgi:hypothetical protein
MKHFTTFGCVIASIREEAVDKHGGSIPDALVAIYVRSLDRGGGKTKKNKKGNL